MLTLGGKLYLAPIPKDIHNALDVGTGTGIWATDFGMLIPGFSLHPLTSDSRHFSKLQGNYLASIPATTLLTVTFRCAGYWN
jgi:hypothetical protein